MGTWETESTKSTFNAKTAVNTATTNRDANRSGSGSTAGISGPDIVSGRYNDVSSYSVVGLNVASIPDLRSRIRVYVSGIQTHLNGIDPLADSAGAFRSEDSQVENAVRDFVNNVKEYCRNLVSNLNSFSDKLQDVSDAWVASTGSLAGTINEDTAASDAGSAYTESK